MIVPRVARRECAVDFRPAHFSSHCAMTEAVDGGTVVVEVEGVDVVVEVDVVVVVGFLPGPPLDGGAASAPPPKPTSTASSTATARRSRRAGRGVETMPHLRLAV